MAKGSGSTRNRVINHNAPTNMHAEKIIKDYAKEAMHSNQTENDIRKFEDADKQGKRWNTGWAEGFKSEINRVANLKVMHDNIPVYQKILKERKKK